MHMHNFFLRGWLGTILVVTPAEIPVNTWKIAARVCVLIWMVGKYDEYLDVCSFDPKSKKRENLFSNLSEDNDERN